jgi:Zn-dependent protease/predicted transcriptional regulator
VSQGVAEVESSFKLGRIAGIEIGVHYTWLFAFALVAWSLAEGFFPSNYRGWDTSTYWLVGVVSALALFGSVLIHELSHSFVALARGQGVHSITLFIFGGVSNIKGEADEPKDEFLVAVVGPLASFGLAGLFWLVDQALALGNSVPGAILSYLSFVNLILGAFNLLPGFPLDGGRVLRSIVWAVTNSLQRATQVASVVGQGIGFLMIFWGVSQMFGGHFFNGLWTAFIGWFLNGAAESVRREQVVKENLRGVRVAELMDNQPGMTAPDLSIHEFVFEHVLRQGRRALLVAQGERLLGIVSITDAKKVPQEQWVSTPVGEIMTPAPLKTVSPGADMNNALQLLVDGTLNQLPVVDNGQLVGMLSRADLLRFLQLREELDIRRMPGRRPRPIEA